MVRLLVLTAALLAAASCQTPPPASADNACPVDRYQSLIGKPLTEADEASLPAKHRVICMGCMATMEFVADRLTIQLGPNKTVASMRCG